MSDFDIESLLSEVSAEAPCGEDLSYDQSFLALEDMVRTKSPGGVVEGVEEAAEEPNWREVRQKSLELLQRSKDLRIAMYLTLALLKKEGIPGLRDGLSLLGALLERFWDHVYPQLDPEDNYDPLERMNILQSLSPTSVSQQDPMKFKQRLAEVPLCSSARMGRFSFRDIQLAKGEIAVSGEEQTPPDMSVIDAAFQDTTLDELVATSQAVAQAIEHAAGITSVFSERTSEGQAPDLSGFQTVLRNIQTCLQGHLEKRGGGPIGEGAGEAAAGPETTGAPAFTGEIRSPKEALLALERICQYFDRHEPSSPVPLLLRRAQRLISKSFLEVIKDFCPDAMGQVEMIGGIGSSESTSEESEA